MSIKAVSDTGDLVPAPRNLPSQLFEDFERLDDDQIIAELQGGVIAEYMYEFQQGGQTIVGLSLPGVMAVAQNMGGITVGQPIWSVDDEYNELVCDISATDHKTGLTVWGTAASPRMMGTKRGEVRDKFARAKALSKAQRNAIRKLIPETVATKMLVMFREQCGGNRQPAPRQQRQQARPASVPAPPAPTVDQGAGEIVDGEFTEPPPSPGDSWQEFNAWAKSLGYRNRNEVKAALGDAYSPEMTPGQMYEALAAVVERELHPSDEELGWTEGES